MTEFQALPEFKRVHLRFFCSGVWCSYLLASLPRNSNTYTKRNIQKYVVGDIADTLRRREALRIVQPPNNKTKVLNTKKGERANGERRIQKDKQTKIKTNSERVKGRKRQRDHQIDNHKERLVFAWPHRFSRGSAAFEQCMKQIRRVCRLKSH